MKTNITILILAVSVIMLGAAVIRLENKLDRKLEHINLRFIFDTDDFRYSVLKTIEEDGQRKECEKKGGEFSLFEGRRLDGNVLVGGKEPRCIIENNISDIYKK